MRQFRQAYFDPRYRFLDSSIWFRYHTPLDNTEGGGLKNTLIDFQSYFEQDLYHSVVTHEFRGFQERLLENSFIETKKEDAGHSKLVTPFGFHCETKMKYLASKNAKVLQKLKWRILLIDDFAEKALTLIDNVQPINTEITKAKIIEDIIKDVLGIEISIEKVTSLEEGKAKLAEQQYNIILLDYLLRDENNKISFGDEFLRDVVLADENGQHQYFEKEKLGLFGKHWIFPISVFQNALTDKMLNAGITFSGKNWLISKGADPICTPHLFAYELAQMMTQQLEEIAEITMNDMNEKVVESKLDIYLNEIVKNPDDIMLKTKDRYPDIVQLGIAVRNLNKFKKENNVFAKSALKEFFYNLTDNEWQHLEHLIYMLLNGNTFFKNQMWEECLFLEKKIDNQAHGTKEVWSAFKHYIAKL